MAIYAAVLSADGHSPLPPKSGDEEAKGSKDKVKDKEEAEKSGDSGKAKKAGEEDKGEKPDCGDGRR